MATFTWQPASGTKAWETTGAGGWGGTPDFTAAVAADDYVVGGTGTLTINQISVDPTIDSVNKLTVTNPNARLALSPLVSAANVLVSFNVASSLAMNAGTIDLGDGPSVLSMATGSTISLGAGAVLTTGASATADVGIDTAGVTTITGTGTILAANGIFNIGPGITIAGGAGNDLHFQIKNNATIEIEDSILGGTFTFENANGGAQLSLLGALPAGKFPATIVGLQNNGAHNDLLFPTTVNSAVITNASAIGANLVINNSTTFALAGDYSGSTTTGLSGTAVTGFRVFVTCYAAGTAILTEAGETAVEAIRAGDAVVTVADGRRTVRTVEWTGERRVDCTRHPRPEQVWPVRVRAGAFGEKIPHRDLWLSPDHAVFVEGVLIPIKYLINHSTIAQVPVNEITYHHLELARHDVLLAEGLPCESYLDTGDRSNFDNGHEVMRLFPDFSTLSFGSVKLWEAAGCAQLVVHGPVLEKVRDFVKTRAAAMAWRVLPESDADNHSADLGHSDPGHSDPGAREWPAFSGAAWRA